MKLAAIVIRKLCNRKFPFFGKGEIFFRKYSQSQRFHPNFRHDTDKKEKNLPLCDLNC